MSLRSSRSRAVRSVSLETAAERCSVKAYIRVRPFNKREIELSGTAYPEPILHADNKVCTLLNPETGEPRDSFEFTQCFWSVSPDSKHVEFATQEKVYADAALPCLSATLDGYNTTIFAYGQTGSGKTHTMMGVEGDYGIIPRICKDLFAHLKDETPVSGSQSFTMSGANSAAVSRNFKVTMSFMEVYNEKVRDLLAPRSSGLFAQHQVLRVRMHPITGPYVEDVSQPTAASWEEAQELINKGNASRQVTATRMNDISSRSHAIIRINVQLDELASVGGSTRRVSANINLVDLAGSERISKSGSSGAAFEEAKYINQSLTTLRRVIDALVELSTKAHSAVVPPFRESILTWVLSDSLGGNSKTVMIATISPHVDNHEETLSTLRYAAKAKKIVNKVRRNMQDSGSMVGSLQREIEMLTSQLNNQCSSEEVVELQERIEANRKVIKDLMDSKNEMEREVEAVMEKLDVKERELSAARKSRVAQSLRAAVGATKAKNQIIELEASVNQAKQISHEQEHLIDALKRQNATRQFVHAIRLHRMREEETMKENAAAKGLELRDPSKMSQVLKWLQTLHLEASAIMRVAIIFEDHELYSLASVRRLEQADVKELIKPIGVRNTVWDAIKALSLAAAVMSIADKDSGGGLNQYNPGKVVIVSIPRYLHLVAPADSAHLKRWGFSLASTFSLLGYQTSHIINAADDAASKAQVLDGIRARRDVVIQDSQLEEQGQQQLIVCMSGVAVSAKIPGSDELPSAIGIFASDPSAPLTMLPTDALLDACACPINGNPDDPDVHIPPPRTILFLHLIRLPSRMNYGRFHGVLPSSNIPPGVVVVYSESSAESSWSHSLLIMWSLWAAAAEELPVPLTSLVTAMYERCQSQRKPAVVYNQNVFPRGLPNIPLNARGFVRPVSFSITVAASLLAQSDVDVRRELVHQSLTSITEGDVSMMNADSLTDSVDVTLAVRILGDPSTSTSTQASWAGLLAINGLFVKHRVPVPELIEMQSQGPIRMLHLRLVHTSYGVLRDCVLTGVLQCDGLSIVDLMLHYKANVIASMPSWTGLEVCRSKGNLILGMLVTDLTLPTSAPVGSTSHGTYAITSGGPSTALNSDGSRDPSWKHRSISSSWGGKSFSANRSFMGDPTDALNNQFHDSGNRHQVHLSRQWRDGYVDAPASTFQNVNTSMFSSCMNGRMVPSGPLSILERVGSQAMSSRSGGIGSPNQDRAEQQTQHYGVTLSDDMAAIRSLAALTTQSASRFQWLATRTDKLQSESEVLATERRILTEQRSLRPAIGGPNINVPDGSYESEALIRSELMEISREVAEHFALSGPPPSLDAARRDLEFGVSLCSTAQRQRRLKSGTQGSAFY